MTIRRSPELDLGRRGGFTLVEMLVVILLLLILATLTVALTPRFAGQQNLAKGAQQLQGWLLIAKQRARRDQMPTGVRLIPDAVGRVRELHLVQVPDHFKGGTVEVNGNMVNGSGVNFWGEYTGSASDQWFWPVQPGDYFEVKGGGLVHRISAVQAAQLTLESAVPNRIYATEDYRVIRRPRLLSGESAMLLPPDIGIDLATNQQYGNALPASNPDRSVDLLFAPSGELINGVTSTPFVGLWLRDTTADGPGGLPAEFGGDPVLIAVQKKTGLIGVQPVNPDPADPYRFCSDGRSSGL